MVVVVDVVDVVVVVVVEVVVVVVVGAAVVGDAIEADAVVVGVTGNKKSKLCVSADSLFRIPSILVFQKTCML